MDFESGSSDKSNKNCLDLGCTLKIELTEFGDRLDVVYDRVELRLCWMKCAVTEVVNIEGGAAFGGNENQRFSFRHTMFSMSIGHSIFEQIYIRSLEQYLMFRKHSIQLAIINLSK